MINKKNKYKFITYISILLLLGLELLQQVLDFIYGDGNGVITLYNVNFYVHIIQLSSIITICIMIIKNSSKILVINFSLFLALLMCIELLLSFFIPIGIPFKTHGSITEGYRKLDEVLGYKPIANTTVSSIRLTLNNDTIYNVKYSTDKNSKRITPLDKDTTSKYALFFGGSFTFGEGVNDNETLPYYFQKYAKEYRSYNIGFNGYGTQQMLENLNHDNIHEDIIEKEGVGVYIFIPDHIRRNSGAMSFYASWGFNHPYFYKKDDHLIRKGTFKTGRNKFINHSFNFLNRFSILKFFDIEIYHPFVNQYKLTADMINESFNAYQKTYKNKNFFILLYHNKKFNFIKPYLDSNIQIFDYSNLAKDQKYRLHEVDRHPNKQGYEKIAKQLSIDIKF